MCGGIGLSIGRPRGRSLLTIVAPIYVDVPRLADAVRDVPCRRLPDAQALMELYAWRYLEVRG